MAQTVPLSGSKVFKSTSTLDVKNHQMIAPFLFDQVQASPTNQHIQDGQSSNPGEALELDCAEDVVLKEDVERIRKYFLLFKQMNAEGNHDCIARRNANIQWFLVICVALVFIAWTGFGLYRVWINGDCSLLLGDAAPGTLFILMVRHFVLQNQE